MWQVIGLLLLLGFGQAQCPAFACAPPGYDLGENICQAEVNGNFWLSLCPGFDADYGCVPNETPNANLVCGTFEFPEPPKAFPGMPCTNSTDCWNNVLCVQGKCMGLDVGSACAEDQECDVGMYCEETVGTGGKCAYQLQIGDACYSDFQCDNNLGCNGISIQNMGTCLPYFNITNGHPVENCVDNGGEGISRLCVSGACVPTTPGVDGPGTCVAPFTSKAPVSCNPGDQCSGSNGQTTTYKECMCGRSSNGGGFCPLFSGDAAVLTVMQLMKTLIANDTSDCHTSGRFDSYCMATHMTAENYEKYVEYADLASNYPLYQQNDNCVQANILNDFYELTADSLSCPSYSCYGTAFTGSACTAFNQGNNTVELNVCAAGNVCSVSSQLLANSTCIQAPQNQPSLYAGMQCSSTSQCIESTCTNGVCVGTASGKACTDTTQCDVGLYCGPNLVCAPLLTAGSSPCFADSDCELTSGCNFNAQMSGTCTTYFSVPNNAAVYCDSTGYQPLCQSAMCLHSLGLNIGTCIPAATSGAPGAGVSTPLMCNEDTDCVGYNGVQTTAFTSKCRCGYNPQGISYCDLFPGDSNYTYYTGLINKVMTETNGPLPCQTTRRFEPDCLALIQNQTNSLTPNELLLAYYEAKEAPILKNNDPCTQQIFTSYYWPLVPPYVPPNPNPPKNDTSGAEMGLAAGVLWLTFA